MALAGVGTFTGLAEAAATAIGSGMLIGGFIAGSIGTALRRDRKEIDQGVLGGGYFGGMVAAVLALVDLTIRYVC